MHTLQQHLQLFQLQLCRGSNTPVASDSFTEGLERRNFGVCNLRLEQLSVGL